MSVDDIGKASYSEGGGGGEGYKKLLKTSAALEGSKTKFMETLFTFDGSFRRQIELLKLSG